MTFIERPPIIFQNYWPKQNRNNEERQTSSSRNSQNPNYKKFPKNRTNRKSSTEPNEIYTEGSLAIFRLQIQFSNFLQGILTKFIDPH